MNTVGIINLTSTPFRSNQMMEKQEADVEEWMTLLELDRLLVSLGPDARSHVAIDTVR